MVFSVHRRRQDESQGSFFDHPDTLAAEANNASTGIMDAVFQESELALPESQNYQDIPPQETQDDDGYSSSSSFDDDDDIEMDGSNQEPAPSLTKGSDLQLLKEHNLDGTFSSTLAPSTMAQRKSIFNHFVAHNNSLGVDLSDDYPPALLTLNEDGEFTHEIDFTQVTDFAYYFVNVVHKGKPTPHQWKPFIDAVQSWVNHNHEEH